MEAGKLYSTLNICYTNYALRHEPNIQYRLRKGTFQVERKSFRVDSTKDLGERCPLSRTDHHRGCQISSNYSANNISTWWQRNSIYMGKTKYMTVFMSRLYNFDVIRSEEKTLRCPHTFPSGTTLLFCHYQRQPSLSNPILSMTGMAEHRAPNRIEFRTETALGAL